LRDDRTNERIIRFLPLGEVGRITFDRNFSIKETSSRAELAGNVLAGLKKWVERSERIVVTASAKNLARVGIVREALNPIYLITYHLFGEDKITDPQIAGLRRPRKIRQYMSFLQELNLVQRTDNGFKIGDAFVSLRDGAKSEGGKSTEIENRFQESVIAFVLAKRYHTLRQVFHVSRLETYVHADNSYYKPSIEADKLLYQTESSLINRFNTMYGFVSPLRLRPVLDELVTVDAIHREKELFVGVNDLFQEMKQIGTEIPTAVSMIA
jgi:hypothetical protein